MKPIIEVSNLSKRYTIGAQRQSYPSLRDHIERSVGGLARRLTWWRRSPAPEDPRELWALNDVSFCVHEGEALGIIGRNGAGKSTLLKVLSQITPPTRGRAILRGRVASLLEVGTGFHPELTGRENIFLNGTILGMTRKEVKRKFDEIVAFAEVERFLDTPVKRYSSGMYVRLAFAVAAHLEPEILLVDEVLAVGDVGFQKKCLGKMGDVARQGRTVLFVSHNLSALRNLCPRAILLHNGGIRADGPSPETVNTYIQVGKEDRGEVVWESPAAAPGNERVRLHAVRVLSEGKVSGDVDIDKEVHVEVWYWNLIPGSRLSASIHLLDSLGVAVLVSINMHSANLEHDEWFGKPFPEGLFRTTCVLPANFLNEGTYRVNAAVLTEVRYFELFEPEVLSFTVHDTGVMRKELSGHWPGVVRPRLAWHTDKIGPPDESRSHSERPS